ncbi:hypothetical protein HQ865_17185 [Mucilaginibacter mali]|uniref:Uncharacterized protein n=1 Tax=Mucilaginibacter mali TaxID=2740462 RepID=A0A7D4QB76_9SPHI|nr:hypothetical protein [Mucilaginibacter mali]QKJ31425.1 hypothetical protein HQ865_17185 [Mucilaginibacter mali]
MAFGFLKRLKQIRAQLDNLTRVKLDEKTISILNFIDLHLHKNPKYLGNKRLNRFEEQYFSQYGEDGIIKEIFNRIGTTNKYFIEFGVENGLECNTHNLLYQDWQGLWIEGSKQHCDDINRMFADVIQSGKLKIRNAFITAENIEGLFNNAGAPLDPDLLSIDIDNNDYYVWQAITNYKPRVAVIEYNASHSPDNHFVVPYKADRSGSTGNYFGASLLALQTLADSKGYKLVGCNFGGNNAFFVREDLVSGNFEAPFTAANHYEPARYFLYHKLGHAPNRLPG